MASFLCQLEKVIETVAPFLRSERVNPHIMGITESWCHKDINERELHIDGYTTYRKDRECAKGGGVLHYVSNNLVSNYCSTLNIHKLNDFIWCA